MAKIKPTGSCLTVLETDVLDHNSDDFEDDFEPLRKAWRDDALYVDSTNRDEVVKALVDLSNHCDYLANDKYGPNADERKIYRLAARGFTTLAARVRRSR